MADPILAHVTASPLPWICLSMFLIGVMVGAGTVYAWINSFGDDDDG